MPSTTRGSILISTANDIGEALVEKLGGVGYSPNEWKEKYNLCGIAPVDSAPALSVLADSAGTGDERGSILIATADAIGAILNKKYNVLRGFKPKEWASACRKMKALEEGSVASASIASFSDGADDVPTKSIVVTIPPTLSGVSSVSETQTGKNLFDKTAITENRIIGHGTGVISTNNAYFVSDYIPVKSGVTYYFTGLNYWYQSYYDENKNLSETIPPNTAKATIPVGVSYLRVSGQNTNIDTAQFEIGESASTYEAFNGTTYTASLGRTIYGGTADIVNGTGTDENGNDFTFDGQEINTRLGYNAFWSDNGNTAVEYYKAPTPYARKTATGGIANFSDQRTDLPLTKAIANIAPSIAGKSAVNLYQGSEQYQPTTTYTAELGETVYGGSVDFVSGEVVNDCAKDSMSSSYLSGLSLETYIGYEAQTAYFNYHPSIWVRNWNYQTAAARTAGGIKCACDEFPASMNNTTIFAEQYRIYFDVNGKNISSVQDFIDYVTNLEQNGKQLEITYELATPTESAIPGRVISPIEGVNNYWNDAGGDTEIQYFENEA